MTLSYNSIGRREINLKNKKKIITYLGMNKLLNSARGEPTKKAWTLTMIWDALKRANFFLPIEENFDTFTIQPNQNLSDPTTIFGWPVYLENLIGHCTFEWNHLQGVHIIDHVPQIRSHRSKNVHYLFLGCTPFQQFNCLYGHPWWEDRMTKPEYSACARKQRNLKQRDKVSGSMHAGIHREKCKFWGPNWGKTS